MKIETEHCCAVTFYYNGGLQGTMLMKLELATSVACCEATKGGFAFGDCL